MINRILTILISFFSITTIYAQETDVEMEGFKGKVKSVTQVTYDSDVDNSKLEEFERRIIKYDSDGNMIESVKYTDRGIFNQEHTYKYDPDGNKIDEIQYSRGKLMKTCKYDSDGNRIEERRSYDSEGNSRRKDTYKYDSDGNRIEVISETRRGTVYISSSFKYDYDGNEIEESHYDSDGTLDTKSTISTILMVIN